MARTFNMITVDGDTSTNDMVAIMCSGLAEHPEIRRKDESYQRFRRALDDICGEMARADQRGVHHLNQRRPRGIDRNARTSYRPNL